MMFSVVDSYRFFALLRMTAKRKCVILNEVKNLYTPISRNIPYSKAVIMSFFVIYRSIDLCYNTCRLFFCSF